MAATNTKTARAGGQTVAWVDGDSGEWYLATGGVPGIELQTLVDPALLAAILEGASSVVATQECLDDLARAVPKVQPAAVPRLLSVARSFARELNGHTGLVLWTGAQEAICGLVEKGAIIAEKTSSALTPDR